MTDLYGSPDATDFGSASRVCTPATGVTELDTDELDEEIKSQYKEHLEEHAPPDVVHVNTESTPL